MSLSADEVFTEGWGNYAIQGIIELQLPEKTISLWPQTPGWIVLLIILVTILLLKADKALRRYWKNAYRRTAVKTLLSLKKDHEQGDVKALEKIPELIKATALQAYPRHEVAALFGHDWELYLDNSYSGASFVENFPGLLSTLSYSPNLSDTSQCTDIFWLQLQCWIQDHHDAVAPPATVMEAE